NEPVLRWPSVQRAHQIEVVVFDTAPRITPFPVVERIRLSVLHKRPPFHLARHVAQRTSDVGWQSLSAEPVRPVPPVLQVARLQQVPARQEGIIAKERRQLLPRA